MGSVTEQESPVLLPAVPITSSEQPGLVNDDANSSARGFSEIDERVLDISLRSQAS